MLLDKQQAKRFSRLFNSFVNYLSNTTGAEMVLNALFREGRKSEWDYSNALLSLVWGLKGSPTIIDAYIERNPDNLNADDLSEIRSWKDGTYYCFPVVRIGDDVVFIHGGYAFAVCGITREIDSMSSLPAVLQTVLLPFDGLITYGTMFGPLPVEMSEQLENMFLTDAHRYIEEHGLVRSAQRYLDVLPEARSLSEELLEQQEGFERDLKERADEQGPTTHPGPYVGLSWEERADAYERYLESKKGLWHAQDLSMIDGWCSKGEPPASVFEAYGRLKKAELVRLVRRYGDLIKGASRMRKAELVQALGERAVAIAHMLVEEAVCWGERQTAFLRRLVEEGGSYGIAFDEVTGTSNIPVIFEPENQVFNVGDAYMLWLAPEIVSALADVDWQERLDQARLVDEGVERIRRLVDLRGVVPWRHAFEEAMQFVDEDLLTDALRYRVPAGSVGFKDVVVGDRYIFFAHDRLIEVNDLDDEDESLDGDLLMSIIASQQSREPRPLSDLDACDSVVEFVNGLDSYRELVAYLDKHVPNDADEYHFSEGYAYNLVRDCQGMLISDTIDSLLTYQYVRGFSDAECNHVMKLIFTLMYDVPRWAYNGWSLNDLRQRGADARR